MRAIDSSELFGSGMWQSITCHVPTRQVWKRAHVGYAEMTMRVTPGRSERLEAYTLTSANLVAARITSKLDRAPEPTC